jgi:hypothetical protein
MQLTVQMGIIVVQAMLFLWLQHMATHQNLFEIQERVLSPDNQSPLLCRSCFDTIIYPYDT